MQKTLQQHSKPTKQPHPNRIPPYSDTPTIARNSNRRSTNTTDLHHKWTLPPKPIGKPNSQKQHGTKPPVQWSITSPISQHDRSIYTDPSTRHRQQEQRRQQATNEKHQDLQWNQQSRMHHLAQSDISSSQF